MTADGIALGRHYDDGSKRIGEKIAYTGERHALLFGPNGSGKGTRFLVPNLLTMTDRSIVVVDPKGELCAITADYRRKLGDVVILNPFNVLGIGSDGFNPLLALDPESPTFYDDAAGIGEALIKVEGKDPHWGESAQGVTVALVMWERLQKGERANLANVRAMLTEPDKWERYTDDNGKTREKLIGGLRTTASRMVEKGGFEIASLAARFIDENNELASIRSTADTQTRWLLSKPMRDDLAKQGVDFARLKEKPTTVYVILPAERMRTHSVWLRLVVVSALRALYRPGGVRTVLMIDEMPALGHLGPLEDAFGLVRGYGVQIVGICQDLTQLKALYNQRWESFIANAGVVMGFAPNDLTTADWLSRRAGQTTVIAESSGESRSLHGGKPGESTNWGQVARPLYLAQELMGLPEGTGLLFLAGMANGVRFFAPPYWQIAQCFDRAAPNPYYEGPASSPVAVPS